MLKTPTYTASLSAARDARAAVGSMGIEGIPPKKNWLNKI